MAALVDFLKDFSLVFLPLFVAMDPLPLVPFMLALSGQVQAAHRPKVIRIALITGLVVGVVFLGLGKGIFLVLGVKISDFLIAGGLVLLVLALRELLASEPQVPAAPSELTAVVPIGTPLLVGPATISLLLVLSDLFSLWLVMLAFLANILVAWAIFSQSRRIIGFLGEGGVLAFSKVAYLLLAAIAVQLIRKGVADIIAGVR